MRDATRLEKPEEPMPGSDDPAAQRRLTGKRLTDIVLSCGMVVVALPFMLLAMLLVKLTSAGPAIYSQRRLGQNGKVFTIYKIRTMRHDCERNSGPKWCQPGDPRVTPIGQILRKTHVDELPQLWNILRGELSLIGPRPERPEIAAEIVKTMPEYRNRLQVVPGLTGLAQVLLPPDVDLAGVRHKLNHDLSYIRNAGPRLDTKILFATVFHVVGVPHETIGRIFQLRSPQSAETGEHEVITSVPHGAQVAPQYSK